MPIYEDSENIGAVVLHKLANFDGARVLEIGCGDGRITWSYARQASHVTAMDPNPDRITTARENVPPGLQDHTHFLVSTIEEFTPPPKQPRFDIAIFGWSL